MAKRWQKEDLAYLKKHGALQGVAELAAHFGVEESEIVEKLAELGIVRIVEATRTYGDATSAALLAEGLEHLQRGDWKKAAERFEKVLVEDDGVIAARARQFLAISKQREAAAGKSAVRGAEDSFLEAVMLRNRGDLDAALEVVRQNGNDKKEPRHAYLAAAILAVGGRFDEAAAALAQAIELDSKNRIHAFHDADFAELRRISEHRSLFELP